MKVTQSCPTLCNSPWDSAGHNTGVGCHALFQGVFQTQFPNPGLPHYRRTLYHLSNQGVCRLVLMQNKTPLRQMKGTLHSITQVSLTVWSWVCPPEPRMKLWAHTSHWPIRGRPCRPDLQVHLVLTRVWPSPAPRGP